MRIAAINWKTSEWKKINQPDVLLRKIKNCMEVARQEKVDIIVFSGYTGCFFQQLSHPNRKLRDLLEVVDSKEYIRQLKTLSRNYRVVICPGSYWQREENRIYHESVLMRSGEILLAQKQIYLTRWERELGISRGTSIKTIKLDNWRIGIIVSTDVFYPQVSRYFGVKGANLILSPVGFIGKRNPYLQTSGMWQEVQQNQFFAVESGFNGMLGEINFWSETIVHAPLEMTEKEDGYLDRNGGQKSIIIADLDNKKRKKTILKYNVLNQLNKQFYRTMKIFHADG